MSPGPISRRRLIAGTGAELAAEALPVGAIEALAAEMPSTAEFKALPAVFDAVAFCNDLLDAGCRIHATMPTWRGLDDDDRQPGYFIAPPKGRGFGADYSAVMAKWSDAMEACPDHIGEVVRYAFGRLGVANSDPEVRRVADDPA